MNELVADPERKKDFQPTDGRILWTLVGDEIHMYYREDS